MENDVARSTLVAVLQPSPRGRSLFTIQPLLDACAFQTFYDLPMLVPYYRIAEDVWREGVHRRGALGGDDLLALLCGTLRRVPAKHIACRKGEYCANGRSAAQLAHAWLADPHPRMLALRTEAHNSYRFVEFLRRQRVESCILQGAISLSYRAQSVLDQLDALGCRFIPPQTDVPPWLLTRAHA